MQTYKIVLQQGGAVQHTMTVPNVTAAEVIVLRRLHGANSVISIEKHGEVDLLNEEVRLFLNKKYGNKRVEEVFGDSLVELPTVLNETVMGGVGRGSDAALEEAIVRKRSVKTKRARKKAEPVQEPVSEPVLESAPGAAASL